MECDLMRNLYIYIAYMTLFSLILLDMMVGPNPENSSEDKQHGQMQQNNYSCAMLRIIIIHDETVIEEHIFICLGGFSLFFRIGVYCRSKIMLNYHTRIYFLIAKF